MFSLECTYALTNGQTDSRTEIVIFRALAGAKNWTCSQQGQELDLHELLFANISKINWDSGTHKII